MIAAVKERQAADWRRFLTLRAAELRQGGRLLVGYTARTAAETGWEWLMGELWACVEDMGRDGLFTAEERTQITIPIGLRTLEEIRAPFADTGEFSGLAIEHCELVRVDDPYWDEFQQTGDARHSQCARQTLRGHGPRQQSWNSSMEHGIAEPSTMTFSTVSLSGSGLRPASMSPTWL